MSAETAPVTDISGTATSSSAAAPKKPQQAKRLDVASATEPKRLPPKDPASPWPGMPMPSMDVTKFFEEGRERLKDAFEQANGRFDSFREAARDTSEVCHEAQSAALGGIKDINEHVYELVQSEVDRSYDFVRAATQVKGVSELMQLQADYVRDTMESRLEQAKTLAELTTTFFKSAYAPFQQGFATIVENARKRG